MGTRGALGFYVNGQEHLTYNHWDSYPEGLGTDVVGWLAKHLVGDGEDATLAPELLADLADLENVSESETPTPEQLDKLAKRLGDSRALWENVDTGLNFYAYLRKAQGDLDKTIESGFIIEANGFPLESLFCEWAYVIDVDAKSLDVYTGFQTEPPTDGLWVGKRAEDQTEIASQYYPVNRVLQVPFAQIRTWPVESAEKSFLDAVQTALPGEEDDE